MSGKSIVDRWALDENIRVIKQKPTKKQPDK